jgi:hypothetical protein
VSGGRAIDASDDIDADATRALDVDPQLAEHAPGPRVATADGGIIDADDDTEIIHNETGRVGDTDADESAPLAGEIADVAPFARDE